MNSSTRPRSVFPRLGGSPDRHKADLDPLIQGSGGDPAQHCQGVVFIIGVLKAADDRCCGINEPGKFSQIPLPAEQRALLPACYQQHNAANERQCACNRRQQYRMCLVASSMNRSDVNDLFPGRVRKTSPRKTDQPKYNQDHPKRFIHGTSFVGGSWQ
jgi:hypothetical protein